MSEPSEYTIKVSLAELALIGQALAAQPYGAVRDVIANIHVQTSLQQAQHEALIEEALKARSGNA